MMLFNTTPKCKRCGKRYPIILGDDLPAMMGFKTKEGSIINVCKRCIIEAGKMSDDERDKFFEELGVEHE